MQETDTSSNPIDVKEKLTTMDRATNVFIGATLGLAVGGTVVMFTGMAVTPWLGCTVGAQMFVMGALTFDAEAMIFGPLYFVTLDPIEWDS